MERRAGEELALRHPIPFSLLDTVSDSGGERKDRGVGVFLCLPAYHRSLSVGLGSDVESVADVRMADMVFLGMCLISVLLLVGK